MKKRPPKRVWLSYSPVRGWVLYTSREAALEEADKSNIFEYVLRD